MKNPKTRNRIQKSLSVLLVIILSLVFTYDNDAVRSINKGYKSMGNVVQANELAAADVMPTIPHPNAKIYQAEEAVLSGGAYQNKDHQGYTGSGFVIGYSGNNTASTKFKVDVKEKGEYFISLRYCAGDVGGWPKDRTVGLSVNEGPTQKITCTGTDASWNTWLENIQKVSLNAGSNTIDYKCINADNSSTINLDKLSVWAYNPNPTMDAITFSTNDNIVGEGYSVKTEIYAVNSNGIQSKNTASVEYSSSNTAVATVDKTGTITGVSAGTASITAVSGSFKAVTNITVAVNPTVTVDFANVQRPVNHSMFGYILTPNYEVPDSRMTLLGPIINRETIPVQNFQAIGDLDGSYYTYEGSVMQRCLEAYRRAKANNLKWYMLMGMNPSWASASGNPMDTGKVKTPEQLARFKEYVKDVLQYLKDNGAKPDFADLTNEYWTGLEPTFKAVWEAVREVYPDDIPAVGPGAVGFAGIPDFYLPFASKNEITVEGPSWHEFWTSNTYAPYSQLKGWADKVASYQKRFPETNGKYIVWEENNAGSKDATDWTRSMANAIRVGVNQNIKGCLEGCNWNGMSDLLTTNVSEQNPAARRGIWWVYYMFGQMSGDYVDVTTDGKDDFTATACADKNESKVIFAKNGVSGAVNLKLNNLPYKGKKVSVDLYKITSTENNGLEYQYSLNPEQAVTGAMNLKVDKVSANESWMAVIKLKNTAPSFFCPMTPDDGEVVTDAPTLTWNKSQGSDSYTVTVSKNKDLSKPIINKSGITGTSYTVGKKLTVGQKYYWSVMAKNKYGSTKVSHDVKYSFLVGKSDKVPGQFSPFLPSMNADNEAVLPELTWSTAYNAKSYRVVVSKNKDLSEPIIDKADISRVRGTGQFGDNSQGYYRLQKLLDYNTTYYWKVYAVNESGERPMNGPVHYFTTKAKGDAPTSFSLVSPKNGEKNVSGRAVLSWKPSKNAFFYSLEVSENADMSDPVIVRDRMIYNKYTVEQNLLKPNTKYYWRVTALTRKLNLQTLDSNKICSFTTEAVPCSPLLYAEKGGNKKVTLRFHKTEGADSYQVMYGTKPGKYTKTIKGVKQSPFDVTGLKNDVKYYFAVVAVNKKGKSSIWNERTATPTSEE